MLPFTQIRSPWLAPFSVYQSTELKHSITMLKHSITMASMSSLFLSSRHHKLSILTPFNNLSSQIEQKEDLPFMAQYLISSFGLSEDRAIMVSSSCHITPIKNLDQPESVIRFLRENGLTDTDIKRLIKWNPQLLSANVERVLKPRANQLVTAGVSREVLVQLIKSNPMALKCRNTLSVLQFWSSFVNNNEKVLLKVIKRNQAIMSQDVDKISIPKMNLLREYGFSDQRIVMLLTSVHGFMRRNPDKIKLLLEQTSDLGLQRESRMFVHGLIMVASLKKDTIERKKKFFKKTYNWSEEEVCLAINKYPYILKFSEENVRSTIDFLVTKLGFDMKDIAFRPFILAYSLKGRLIPRHYVMNVLKSKGVQINYCSRTVIMMTEEKFFEKLIEPYKKEVPELGDSYAAFLDGKMSN